MNPSELIDTKSDGTTETDSDNVLLYQINVQGVVQSVGFRPFIKNLADRMGITGWVKNNGSEGVSIQIKCTQQKLLRFIDEIKNNKPELSQIFELIYQPVTNSGESEIQYSEFVIRKSTGSYEFNKQTSHKIASIPPDITMCNDCVQDITISGRRYNYPMTSCTNCGPRYTTIRNLPYDRETTSFDIFALCPSCQSEYINPQNRRFHAQTTCCPECGPKYSQYNKNANTGQWKYTTQGSGINYSQIGNWLKEGKILTVMGQGGTHYVVDAKNYSAVERLRKVRRKNSTKPFALMAKDIETVKQHCSVSQTDERWLLSIRRPIVILPAKNPETWDLVAPNMVTLGVMLPYTGFHHLLFNHQSPDLLVVTSANLPNLPMPITSEQVLEQTKSIADIAFVHNREIVQRIDDSVIRSYKDKHYLIRRSRGFVPAPFFNSEFKGLDPIIALGAEMVNTASIVADGKLFQTQHIGNINNLELLQFQYDAISHLLDLYQIIPQQLVLDLHPAFLTRINGETLKSKYSIEDTHIFEVQHHLAHAMSLIADQSLPIDSKGLIWSCDGYGYGLDGSTWGGELLKIEGEAWKRIASIDPVSYPGGDINAIYPDRQLAIYLETIGVSAKEYSNRYKLHLKHGNSELDLLVQKVHNDSSISTSMGRFLDACSALLNISHQRTYRGEPAITLEQHALKCHEQISVSDIDQFLTTNNAVNPLKSSISGSISNLLGRVNTLTMFERVYDMKMQGNDTTYISKWLLWTLGEVMGELCNKFMSEIDHIDFVGFTGGVAYNKLITDGLIARFDNRDTPLVLHDSIPPGDAGICVGQSLAVGRGLL